MDWLPPSCSEK